MDRRPRPDVTAAAVASGATDADDEGREFMTVLAPEDPGRGKPRPETRLPAPEVDLSTYVLAAVDEHLATLQSVRRQLAATRKVDPGTCWNAAENSVSSARRYAEEMAQALRLAP